jgi:SpoVK/Ycf46/Vps4 family AAA+-type ATPase
VDIDVYRIDLSMVISKFIGETEKNLSRVFDRAENKDWILFFDEADALFGKRTEISDAHDRYANQEISYLLQRVEDFPGTVLLATNLKTNLDDAFMRRFQSVIHFPMPGKEERFRIWSTAMPSGVKLARDVNLEDVAGEFELSGASIVNTIQYCLLMSLETNDGTSDGTIDRNLIIRGIRKELQKEGKTL